MEVTVTFLLGIGDSAYGWVFLWMKAVKCSVEGTIFLPLLGQVEWSEKLEAAETAATCFVLEDFDE